MLELQTVKGNLQKNIDDLMSRIDIYNKIHPALLAYDGKAMNKRLETAVAKYCPEFNVRFSREYDMYHLYIWRQNKSYNDYGSIHLHLGFLYEPEDSRFTMDQMVKRNTWLENMVETLHKYKEGMKKVEEWVNRRNEINRMENQLYNDMSEYQCSYIFKAV